VEPHIRFCTTPDGVRIAYATMGEGSPPIISAPIWFSPFKNMAHEPRVASIYRDIASKRQLILFDRRGTGMSDRDVDDFSRGALVRDLEAVIGHLKLRRVVLTAWDMAGAVAIEYAHRHPNRVSHLILTGCYARGQDLGHQDAARSLAGLMRSGWDVAPEMLPTLVMPGVDPETARHYFTALRESCSGESAAAQLEAALTEDVTHLLPEIRTPALVLHAREDRMVPFELGRELASLLPNARLVPLDWEAHWDPRNAAPMLQAMDEFLNVCGQSSAATETAMTGAFRTILFTDVEGSTALTQRLGDAKARGVLREHERIVREALAAHGGSEVKTMGDGFMASFGSATKALECAIAIQRAFAARNEGVGAHGHAPLQVRIGLNAGEPIAEEDPDGRGDLFGTAVNLAARIAAQAKGGEILVSNVVRELVAGKGFLFSDREDAVLRGFEDPVRLYDVRWREE